MRPPDSGRSSSIPAADADDDLDRELRDVRSVSRSHRLDQGVPHRQDLLIGEPLQERGDPGHRRAHDVPEPGGRADRDSLLERLESLFETEIEEVQMVPEAARRDVAQLKHRGSVTEQAFEKPYEAEPVSYPLGESGLLLTQFSYQHHESGRVVATLSGDGGKGLTLNMDSKLQHHLYEIITRACQRAEWFEVQDRKGKPVVH